MTSLITSTTVFSLFQGQPKRAGAREKSANCGFFNAPMVAGTLALTVRPLTGPLAEATQMRESKRYGCMV